MTLDQTICQNLKKQQMSNIQWLDTHIKIFRKKSTSLFVIYDFLNACADPCFKNQKSTLECLNKQCLVCAGNF